MLLMVSGPSPVFVSVTVWVALVVPTCCAVKFSVLPESATFGMTPFPVRVID